MPLFAIGAGIALIVGCSGTDGDGGISAGRAGASSLAAAGMPSGSGSGGTATGGSGGNPLIPDTAGMSGGSSGTGGSSGGMSGGGSGSGGKGGSGGMAGSTSGGAGGMGGATGADAKSGGCGKMRTLQDGKHMVQSGGMQRSYVLKVPANYDNARPYRLILGFHGAGGTSNEVTSSSYFGLWDLSQGSTIFAAPDAAGAQKFWNAASDTAMVTDLLKALKDDLCIDTSRIELEGFSQGGAMVWTLACALPGTFRLAVVHSGGGLPVPATCQPLPFFSSLGTDGSGQGMSSDFFAKTNGCTMESFPDAPSKGHACTNYKGCKADYPTRWCDYDDGHTPAPRDGGQNMSWMPQEVWNFVKQF